MRRSFLSPMVENTRKNTQPLLKDNERNEYDKHQPYKITGDAVIRVEHILIILCRK